MSNHGDNYDKRIPAAVIGFAVAVHLAHQWWYRGWTIDDAAISFAYARNAVHGWGLVAVPGGERIEGYSNPLWVALLAGWELLGVHGFDSAKWMAAAFGSATILWVWRLARRALPDDPHAALIAPLALGFSAHHAIWAASSLENSLMTFLVIGGLVALCDDLERDRWPRSALWFLGVGLTRPEGIGYAAIAGLWFALFTWRDGRGGRPIARWLALCGLPFGAFLAFRLWYFAWPLPMTYYAKVWTEGSEPWRWYARGWSQIRDFSARLWQGWFLPLFGLGLIRWEGRRRWLWLGLVVLFAILLGIPGPDVLEQIPGWPFAEDPLWWIRTRVAAIAVVASLLPLAALSLPGGRARATTWSMASFAIAFSVISNGDWMDGLRWMSLFAPQTAVLLAVGTAELARAVGRTLSQPTWGHAGWAIATAAVLLQIPPNLAFTRWYRPIVDDYPEMIRPRVRHSEIFATKVFLEEPLQPLDMDMGAHLIWSAQRPVDMAGLVDVPIATHTYAQTAFISEYVFQERRPHVAHVHLTWAKATGFLDYPEWKRDYFQYTGYVDHGRFHDGLYGRKDLVMNDLAVDPADTVGFERGMVLRGVDVPSPEVAIGGRLYVDTAWSTRFTRDSPVSVTLFLSRGSEVHSWDLPLGYTMNGYPAYPIEAWRPMEAFRGQYAVRLPEDLAPGSWDLGFAVRDADGRVLAAGGTEADPQPVAAEARVGGREAPPVFARGEVVFAGRVVAVTPERATEAADADRIAALSAAWGGDCRSAEDRWILAKRHLPRDGRWQGPHLMEFANAVARCWAELAEGDRDLAPARLARAQRWAPNNPEFLRIKQPIADALYAEGKEARARADWETAYARFRDVLSFAPERSWARRYAEEARDHRLGLTAPPTDAAGSRP